MRRKLFLTLLFYLAAVPGFAQQGLNGRWATDKPANLNPVSDFQRSQSVQLELSVQDAKVSGALTIGGLGGTLLTFKDGKLNGNKFQFKTTPDKDPNAVTTWTVELTDENTVLLSHGIVEIENPRVGPLKAFQAPSPVQVAAVPGGVTRVDVSGIVQDASRAFIPGVTVTATGTAGQTLSTISDEAGRYSFSDVSAGDYAITATLSGFRSATASNIRVGSGQVRQDFTMEIMGPPQWTLASCSAAGQVLCRVLHRVK